MRQILVFAVAALALSACATTEDEEPIDIVSVRYDPYSYSMAKLQKSADALCRAKGATAAYPISNDINSEAVRWAYMNFECY